MTNMLAPPAPPRPRRRWLKRFAVAGLIVLIVTAGCFALLLYLADREWREAVAEADRLDPGWRREQLEARRVVVPDDANAARCVLAADKLLPAGWPVWPAGSAVGGEAVEKSFDALPPTAPLAPRQRQALSEVLAAAQPALAEARKLKDLPAGRYPPPTNPGTMGPVPWFPAMRNVAALLAYDALLRGEEEGADAALESCRALLNAARSIGDEPDGFEQRTRLDLRSVTCRKIERALAQGRPTGAALAALQTLLEDEEAQPVLLFGARGQRLFFHELFEAAYEGRLKNQGLDWAMPTMAAHMRGPSLRASTEVVEIFKLPAEERRRALKEGLASVKDMKHVVAVFVQPKIEHLTHALSADQDRSQAELRCTIVALAAERHRLAHGSWPASPAALVPAYLSAVPTDPFDGQPVRLVRVADRIVIYCVGPDGTDDGGKLDRRNTGVPGNDLGVQVWDAERRR